MLSAMMGRLISVIHRRLRVAMAVLWLTGAVIAGFKVSGRWRYVYRAIDQFWQVIDVYVSPRRDGGAARCFFTRALATTKVVPVEVTTDQAVVYPHVLDELAPGAWHCTQLYANNRIEADHGQLKRRLRPMRGLKNRSRSQNHHRRTRVHPEHPPRPLRTRETAPHLALMTAMR
jgi:hypothetical protein